MILVVCSPLACSAGTATKPMAYSPLDSPTFASTPYCHFCRVYRQLPRRGKANHLQGCSALYLCCCLLSVIVYFMLSTEHNRQRISPRLLLLLYSVNKPFNASPSTTVIAVMMKARTPTTASTTPPSPMCIPFVAHLRHWRWFIISLIFFYGLVLFASPARATSVGVALRVSGHSNLSWILGRSQRSTQDFERLFKTDVGFLCLVDGTSEMVEPKLFLGICENGTLAVTKEPKHELKVHLIPKTPQTEKESEDEKEEGNVEEPQYEVIFSDRSRRWLLCLNGSIIISMEICLDEAQPKECSWTGVQESMGIRILPLVHPQQDIHLGEYTIPFHDVVLRLQRSVKAKISQGDDCSKAREILQPAAKKDLYLAKLLMQILRTAQQKLKLALLKRGERLKAVHATTQIINQLVQVRHDMKMVQWDYEGITASDQKGFIGISGCRYKVPETVEEEIDVYATFKAKQQNLAWKERKLIRSLFDRTKKLASWSDASLLAYKQHPSLSRIFQGLKFLPRNMTDLETNLHLVPRYLWKKYTSKVSKGPLNVQERAILLKLEEVVVRRRHKDLFFLNKAECMKDWLKHLPGRGRSPDVINSDLCESVT
ncbi:hypothetical protein TcWFU_000652 [Taenia crassiceps]|uniref:Uncharacterized protein n=1 Tax=Taenia crassiceps TaxID=6207 RepID=A0ABR4QFQ5_9CEST